MGALFSWVHLRRMLGVGAALGAVSIGVLVVWIIAVPYPVEQLSLEQAGSTRVTDRYGQPLRDLLGPEGVRWSPVARDAIADAMIEATLAGEDHRFWLHIGVDPWAILRATQLNLREGRVYSGASTLTMQLVRLIEPASDRSLATKVREAIAALRLERAVDKDTILAQYLNRASYGPGIRGVEMASRLYFGISAQRLSLAQAAFLAALPRAPRRYDPYRHMARALRRQRHILRLMRDRAPESERPRYETALKVPLHLLPRQRPFEAPHFVDHLVVDHPELFADHPAVVRTSLDLELQHEVEVAVGRHVAALGHHAPQAAVLVLDHASGEVLAWVGSRDWRDVDAQGRTRGVMARRAPGSTLKPFIYAMAFEQGWGPHTVLPDLPLQVKMPSGEVYIPRNYDGRYRGPVRVRDALAGSLNTPAVRTLQHVGVLPLVNRLKAAGMDSLESPGRYGPSLALGGAEVSLHDLTRGYASLARGGTAVELRVVPSPAQPQGERVMEEAVSYLVTDILTDEMARQVAFGGAALRFSGAVALKTGTSDGSRD
ncbi:MAG: transglycosylase domain-containing protein, partial [Myxococcota bacterium]